MLLEVAEGLKLREAGALEPLVRITVDQLDGEAEPEAPVHARDARQRLAHDQRVALGVARLGLLPQSQAHVAASAARERLGLVAEISQDRVVAAAAALGPANQLEEHAPLVLEHGAVRRRVAGAPLE